MNANFLLVSWRLKGRTKWTRVHIFEHDTQHLSWPWPWVKGVRTVCQVAMPEVWAPVKGAGIGTAGAVSTKRWARDLMCKRCVTIFFDPKWREGRG